MSRLRKLVRKGPYIFRIILAEMWGTFVWYLVGLALEMLFLLLVALAVVVFFLLPIPSLIFSLASGGVYAHQRAQQRRLVEKQPVGEEPEERVLLRAADRSARDRVTLLRSIASVASADRSELLRAGILDRPVEAPVRRRQGRPANAALMLPGAFLIAFGLGTGIGYAFSSPPEASSNLPAHPIRRHAYEGKLIQDVNIGHSKTGVSTRIRAYDKK